MDCWIFNGCFRSCQHFSHADICNFFIIYGLHSVCDTNRDPRGKEKYEGQCTQHYRFACRYCSCGTDYLFQSCRRQRLQCKSGTAGYWLDCLCFYIRNVCNFRNGASWHQRFYTAIDFWSVCTSYFCH